MLLSHPHALYKTVTGATLIESELGTEATESTRGETGGEEKGETGSEGNSSSFSSTSKSCGVSTVEPESPNSCVRGAASDTTRVELAVVGAAVNASGAGMGILVLEVGVSTPSRANARLSRSSTASCRLVFRPPHQMYAVAAVPAS